jgi:hypothetical protein
MVKGLVEVHEGVCGEWGGTGFGEGRLEVEVEVEMEVEWEDDGKTAITADDTIDCTGFWA